MTLPEAYETRMRSLLGEEEYTAYLASLERDAYSGIRINGLKAAGEEIAGKVLTSYEKIPWSPNGYLCPDGDKPSDHPYYYAGLYYLQEPSAMAPASFLPVTPGDRVLDLCAAPGGKTTELASKLQGEGVLIANDISASRIKALQKNLELFGVKNAAVLCEEPSRLLPAFRGYFDKILIDAPCSGEGMFRKKGSMTRYWEEHGPDYYAQIQKNLIRIGADLLAPGGQMIYSTCTFSVQEDEEILAGLLAEVPGMHLLALPDFPGKTCGKPEWSQEIPEEYHEELRLAARFFPHKVKGEGHFVALLEKEGERPVHAPVRGKANRLPAEAQDFLSELTWDLAGYEYRQLSDRIYLVPAAMPDLAGLRVQRCGLFAGILKKNRFEPVEALAMALKASEYPRSISFGSEDERVKKYLKGETIDLLPGESPGKGWCLVCTDGYPLGWAKCSGSQLKNKYHPGWRMM